jgi:hypothetical protein
MSHPYKSVAHKNDPKWVGRLSKQLDAAEAERKTASDRDVAAITRNYGGDKSVTDKAAYASKEG